MQIARATNINRLLYAGPAWWWGYASAEDEDRVIRDYIFPANQFFIISCHYNLRLRNRDFSLPAKDEKYYIPLEFCIDLVDV